MGIIESRYVATGGSIGFECVGPGAGNDPAFRFGALAYGTAGGVVGEAGPGMTRLLGPYSTFAGVHGTARDFTGVAGTSLHRVGVYGQLEDFNAPGDFRAGVLGMAANNPGVVGFSDVGDGIQGVSIFLFGVYGRSFINDAVVGISDQKSGVVGTAGAVGAGPNLPPQYAGNPPGVLGKSDLNPGVVGASRSFPGVIGFGVNAQGVLGISDTNIGVHGKVTTPGGFAGVFDGNVVINGDLAVSGPNKSAVVRFPDGSNRLLYCMESPEHWFEDFGSGKLRRGRAAVKLDADFARVIATGDYRVFLTPEGDCNGLYVTRKSGRAFEVRELNGGTSNVAFSYRIVGRRKDIRGRRRFAKFDAPVPPETPRPKPRSRSEREFLAELAREARAKARSARRNSARIRRGKVKSTPRRPDPLVVAVREGAAERKANPEKG